MNSEDQYLIVLAKLEHTDKWLSTQHLQEAVQSVIELVNTAYDITGIAASGLMVDYWGKDPVVSFFVLCDDRFGEEEDTDDMVFRTFAKAVDLCGYRNDMRVLTGVERRGLDTG